MIKFDVAQLNNVLVMRNASEFIYGQIEDLWIYKKLNQIVLGNF